MDKFFLLADDDLDDAELFSEALSTIQQPVKFHHVPDGQAVFKFLNDAAPMPNIIFLDLNMPEMSGWQCLAKLKNEDNLKSIPVIMYSTSSNPREKDIAIDLGALGFITKPSSFTDLTRILERIVQSNENDLKKVLREIAA